MGHAATARPAWRCSSTTPCAATSMNPAARAAARAALECFQAQQRIAELVRLQQVEAAAFAREPRRIAKFRKPSNCRRVGATMHREPVTAWRGYEPARRAGFAHGRRRAAHGVARTPYGASAGSGCAACLRAGNGTGESEGRTVRVATPGAGAGLRRLAGVGGTCGRPSAGQSGPSAGKRGCGLAVGDVLEGHREARIVVDDTLLPDTTLSVAGRTAAGSWSLSHAGSGTLASACTRAPTGWPWSSRWSWRAMSRLRWHATASRTSGMRAQRPWR